MIGRRPLWRWGLPARRVRWMHLGRTALVLIALAALNNLLGYARDIVLAAWYGASPQTDAFFVGSFVPLLVNQVVVLGSLVPAFLPVLVQTSVPGPDGAAARRRLVRTMAGLAAGLGLGLVGLLGLAAPAVVAVVAPGFAPATAAQAVLVLQLSLPLLAFALPAGVLSAALNHQDRFVAPALAAAATNLGIVAALLLAGRGAGIAGAAIGMSVGSAAGLLIVIFDFRFSIFDFGSRIARHPEENTAAAGQNPKSKIQNRKSAIVRTAQLALPLLGTVALLQTVAVVERLLGSRLAPGSLSLLAYAMKLNLLPVVILAGTLTTILFPTLSRSAGGSGIRDQGSGVDEPGLAAEQHATRNTQHATRNTLFSRALARGIAQVLTWTVPAACWLVVCAGPVMRLLYQRGQFSDADSAGAARLLAIYAAGLVPHALVQMLPRAFHARQDMLRPLALHGLALAGYLALAVPLSAAAGAAGLAAAFSAYAYLAFGLFAWGLRDALRPAARALGRTLARTLTAGLALAAVCAGMLRLTGGWPLESLAGRAGLVAGLAVAGGTAYALSMTLLGGEHGGTGDD